MHNKGDYQTIQTLEQLSAPQTPEAKRRQIGNTAEFMVEQAVSSMYPNVALAAEFAISGYPDNAEEVARTSTAAAHQAIQSAIAGQQGPEAN